MRNEIARERIVIRGKKNVDARYAVNISASETEHKAWWDKCRMDGVTMSAAGRALFNAWINGQIPFEVMK